MEQERFLPTLPFPLGQQGAALPDEALAEAMPTRRCIGKLQDISHQMYCNHMFCAKDIRSCPLLWLPLLAFREMFLM